MSEERELLLGYLQAQRRHVLGIVDGLDEEAMAKPVLPSGWSCRALVHHLALDVERLWFAAVQAAAPDAVAYYADQPDGWQVPEGMTAAEVLELYRREAERADAVITRTPLDAAPAWWPEELFGTGWRMHDLRQVVLHVLVETAAHAGHLDAARELLDGRQWLVITE
ncbi:MAG: DinB family protein [Motilibacteraceae bacterium]